MSSLQTLAEVERRLLAGWAAAVAEHVLPLFESEAPEDDRPRDAIRRARAFSRGQLATATEIRERFVAFRAAGGRTPAAAAAAQSAAHAAAVAHMGAHALAAAAYAVKAAGLSEGAETNGEANWQIERLTPEVRSVLSRLPRLGDDPAGPLGKGLLTSGALAATIRRLQDEVASG